MNDKLKVHMLKADKIFEGTTEEVCKLIGEQIDKDLEESK